MRRAFTLIELLVVIAVVVVLFALLLPGLQGARRTARSDKCLANLRSIVTAVACYRDGHRGWTPGDIVKNLEPDLGPAGTCPADPDRGPWSYSIADASDPYGRPLNDAAVDTLSPSLYAIVGDAQPWHGFRNVGYLDGHAGRERK
jgi:prepilin-type N-terminal cleavage/methylation domain-containing protein